MENIKTVQNIKSPPFWEKVLEGDTYSLVILFLLVMMLGFGLYSFYKYRDSKVEIMTQAGILESVVPVNRGSQVVTSKAYYHVQGVFQGENSSSLILETRKSGNRYLCLESREFCLKLSKDGDTI